MAQEPCGSVLAVPRYAFPALLLAACASSTGARPATVAPVTTAAPSDDDSAGKEVHEVWGRLPPADIQRVVRASFAPMRICYENELRRHPDLTGSVLTKFLIERDGSVSGVTLAQGSTLGDPVAPCVSQAFRTLVFPKPEGGRVAVVYPILFNPGMSPAPVATSEAVPRADAVIAGIKPTLKRCYDEGLKSDRRMSGKLVFAIKLTPNGDVASTDVQSLSSGAELSADVLSCMAGEIKSLHFDPPGPRGAIVQFPLTLMVADSHP